MPFFDVSDLTVFGLVMIRLTGMIVPHPFFGRRGIPATLNAGFALVLTILITTSMPIAPLPDVNMFTFLFLGVKEFAVGFMAGMITRMFLAILVVGGEVIDMQLAIGMAKVFDPGTNASVSLTSTMFNSMYALIFFLTNNHLTLISLTAQTFRMIPVGNFRINWQVMYYLPEFMSTIFLFAFKLAMPMIAIQVIVTIAVGIIMRAVPQINIFVLNIQFKLIIGLFVLITLIVPFVGFFERLVILNTEQIQHVWGHFIIN